MHQLLMLNVTELEVTGDALVNSISDCPPIVPGEGSVVTARFVTRQVDVIARVSVLGANGEIEIIQGTTIHPIWSVDRRDWVELSELQPGESLQGAAGIATVLRVDIEQRSLPVYTSKSTPNTSTKSAISRCSCIMCAKNSCLAGGKVVSTMPCKM